MGIAIGATAAAEGPAGPPASASAKLRKSAQEFEAILLASWLEKMNHSFVGESASEDAAHDTLSSLGTQAVASALAERGGIGVAAMLLRQLQPAAPSGPLKAGAAENSSSGARAPRLAQAGERKQASNIKAFSPIADPEIARQ